MTTSKAGNKKILVATIDEWFESHQVMSNERKEKHEKISALAIRICKAKQTEEEVLAELIHLIQNNFLQREALGLSSQLEGKRTMDEDYMLTLQHICTIANQDIAFEYIKKEEERT